MLYVSERVARNKFCVTDTDDMKTSVATKQELLKWVSEGLDIKGVNIKSKHIEVYSVLSNKDTLKLNMMYGVSLAIKDGVLNYISAPNFITNSLNLRLSDYCDTLGKCIIGDIFIDENCSLIITLDNNLTFNKNTFYFDNLSSCVQFNIVELTSNRLASYVYAACSRSYAYHFAFRNIILDRRERFIYNLALYLLSMDYFYKFEQLLKFNDITSAELKNMHEIVLDLYKDKFLQVLNSAEILDIVETNAPRFLDLELMRSSDPEFCSKVGCCVKLPHDFLPRILNYIIFFKDLCGIADKSILNAWGQFKEILERRLLCFTSVR